MFNIEGLFYCKKDYFKVQNNVDFEFEKGNYYHIAKSGVDIIFDKNKNITTMKAILTFIIDESEFKFSFNYKEFYEHFLSYEKTKRKLKLDRIKNKKKNSI